MKTSRPILAILAIIAAPAFAQDAAKDTPKMPPLSMATALKLGPDGLIPKYAEDNEEGRDTAAGMYAHAKQMETEYALAQRDLDLANALNDWRIQISHCREDFFSLQELEAGGGSIYLHAMSRDCAKVEDFLDILAKKLPLGEGKGDEASVKAIKDRIAEIKQTKPAADADKDTKEQLTATIEDHILRLEELLNTLSLIPEDDAKLVASFVLDAPKALK